MKRKIAAGVVGLLLAMGGLAAVATPAQAANDCKIYDAWDNSGMQSSTQLSNKGCDYYHGRAKIVVQGNPTWSAYGTSQAPSPSQTHVWTTSRINTAASGVLGSSTQYQYASSPWVYGGYLAH